MVDEPLLAAKIAAIRDATKRIRDVVPASADAFLIDRTTREIVLLNLFVALQEAIALATHWISDAGWPIPGSYREVFLALAEHAVIEQELAERLAAAAGLRNLMAHSYGRLDLVRVHEVATTKIDDLDRFCAALAGRVG